MKLFEDPFDPSNRFVTSWLFPPGALFCIRAILCVYIFTTEFFILAYDSINGHASWARHTFSYFTHLTWWGLAFYFLFAAVQTGSYWLSGKSFLARWPRPLQALHSVLYSTVIVFPFLVTAVYWALLFSHFKDRFEAWSETTQHAFNSVFALFEIVFPRTLPSPWLHIIPLITLLALYLGLAYLTYATKHFYVYSFLDDRIHPQGAVAGYIIGILAGTVVVFVVVRFAIGLRIWFIEKRLGWEGKMTARRSPGRVADETVKDMELVPSGIK